MVRIIKRFLIVIGILALLLGALDRVSCWWAQSEGAQVLEKRGAENSDVKIADLPFLTSVIGGNIGEVNLEIPRWDFPTESGAMPLTDIHAQIDNLQLSTGRLNIEKIGHIKAQASLTQAALEKIVAAKAPGVKTSLQGGKIIFSAKKWGQEILADGQVELSDPKDGSPLSLIIKATSLKTQLPRQLQARLKLPQSLPAIKIPIRHLPAQMQLNKVEIRDDKLVFNLVGKDILLPKKSNS